eukprot:scaffold1087_cov198-Pinguiococcus_pyrenoidosus.AAC.24
MPFEARGVKAVDPHTYCTPTPPPLLPRKRLSTPDFPLVRRLPRAPALARACQSRRSSRCSRNGPRGARPEQFPTELELGPMRHLLLLALVAAPAAAFILREPGTAPAMPPAAEGRGRSACRAGFPRAPPAPAADACGLQANANATAT